MASRLKAEEDERTVGRCPICNRVISLADFYVHLAYHPA